MGSDLSGTLEAEEYLLVSSQNPDRDRGRKKMPQKEEGRGPAVGVGDLPSSPEDSVVRAAGYGGGGWGI